MITEEKNNYLVTGVDDLKSVFYSGLSKQQALDLYKQFTEEGLIVVRIAQELEVKVTTTYTLV